MKKTILLLAALAMAGCYKDKGHYDYSSAAAVTIEMPAPGTRLVGESLTYTPNVTATGEFDYCWCWTGITTSATALFGNSAKFDTLCLTKELTFTPGHVGNNVLRFYMREKSTGVVTQAPLVMAVSTQFDRGWVVLSKDGDRSLFSFVNPGVETIEGVKTRKFTSHPDLYATMFPKDPLGTGPVGLGVEYGSAASGGSLVYVFQDDASVVLSGNAFNKQRPLGEMFVSSPTVDFKPRRMVTLAANPGFSVLQDTRGRIYTRHAENNFMGGIYDFLYSPVPASLQGEDVHVDLITQTNIMLMPVLPLVDLAARRAVAFLKNTGPRGLGRTGFITTFSCPATPEFDYSGWGADVQPLAFYAGNPRLVPGPGFAAFFRFTALYLKGGRARWQTAQGSTAVPTATYALQNFANGDVPTQVELDDQSVFWHLRATAEPLMFIATGNKIWWFDSNSHQFLHFFDLPAGEQVIELMANPQETELVALTRGGTFAVLSIERADIMSGRQIWQTKLPGTAIDLEYKFSDYMAAMAAKTDF